jgi:hypothetical protein
MQTLKDSVTPHRYMMLQYLNEDNYDEHLEFKKKVMFGNYMDADFPAFSLQHACITTARRLLTDASFDRARKVAIVRNPYTRIVSLFFYYGFNKASTFKTFVHEKLPKFAGSSSKLAVNFAAKQTLYTHQNGACVPDLILRQEFMEDSLSMLSHFLSLPIQYDRNMRLRESTASLEFENYMDAYDEESLAIVRELYEEDFDLLGYRR